MSRATFRDPRLWLVAGALLLVLGAMLVPRIKLTRDVYDVVAVVDITTSMNTRDMTVGGEKTSRLQAAKFALRDTLSKLPCGSRLGLGIFTERRTFLLFNPVEVCENFAAIDGAIAMLDWRMAWEGDSYVSKGLYSALDIAHSLKADLIFITDGHELPPLPFSGLAPFDGKPGDVGGLIVGDGGRKFARLLKYDEDGREIGTYGAQDVPQENRSGPPPPDAASRPGYHPKWAPFGNAVVNNKEHLAVVREAYLKQLASVTGLTYAYLGDDYNLVPAFEAAAHGRPLLVATDVSAVPGSLALVLLLALYGLGAYLALKSFVSSSSTSSKGAY
ncbi:VWA domain-containing protein [Hyphomicrobium sp. NDB2Meth4]|uniref:VWA domain-containing protein n=1 Tax=Hyphomicrobium sp. NDB2Meth4 TaxID=1892846 RepID=UPI000930564E|nr:VWA domain-containing protein [Hyphomicrobium sp. NDB2Meth4]